MANVNATSSWPQKTSRKPHQKLGPAALTARPKIPYRATIGEMKAKAKANDDQRLNSRRSA